MVSSGTLQKANHVQPSTPKKGVSMGACVLITTDSPHHRKGSASAAEVLTMWSASVPPPRNLTLVRRAEKATRAKLKMALSQKLSLRLQKLK